MKDHATPTPREAEKIRTLLNSMFNLAMARGKRMRSWLASDSPVVEPWLDIVANPVEGTILANREPSTFRPETRHIRALVNNLDRIEHDDIQQALLLQLYTNTRISEACNAP